MSWSITSTVVPSEAITKTHPISRKGIDYLSMVVARFLKEPVRTDYHGHFWKMPSPTQLVEYFWPWFRNSTPARLSPVTIIKQMAFYSRFEDKLEEMEFLMKCACWIKLIQKNPEIQKDGDLKAWSQGLFLSVSVSQSNIFLLFSQSRVFLPYLFLKLLD